MIQILLLVLILQLIPFVEHNKAENNDHSAPCGHVDELSRATLEPSEEIFIYSGPMFYRYDLKNEKLQETYQMDDYYQGVPHDMEAATLHNPPDDRPAMLFIKKNVIYMYNYSENAFKESDQVIDNMDLRENLEVIHSTVDSFKNTDHAAQSYNAKAKRDERLSICMDQRLQKCAAKIRKSNPVHNCKVNEGLKVEYAKNCKGLTMAEFNENKYLVFADGENIMLFPMDDTGHIESTPYRKLSLSKIFDCSSSLKYVFLGLGVALVISLSLVVIGIVIVVVVIKRGKTRKALKTVKSSPSLNASSVTVTNDRNTRIK